MFEQFSELGCEPCPFRNIDEFYARLVARVMKSAVPGIPHEIAVEEGRAAIVRKVEELEPEIETVKDLYHGDRDTNTCVTGHNVPEVITNALSTVRL